MTRLERKTNWWTTGDAVTPWGTSVDGKKWLVRVNEPPMKRYTLLVDGRPVESCGTGRARGCNMSRRTEMIRTNAARTTPTHVVQVRVTPKKLHTKDPIVSAANGVTELEFAKQVVLEVRFDESRKLERK